MSCGSCRRGSKYFITRKMKLLIAGKQIDKWQNLSLTMVYDSVKSVFSFDVYWDPYDPNMRDIMLPGAYLPCKIVADNGEGVFTGIMHTPSFDDSPEPSLVNISGTSIPGVLDDCEFAAVLHDKDSASSFDSLQVKGLSILQLCQKICNQFAISIVDKTNGAANAIIQNTEPFNSSTCTDVLSKICKEQNIVLSHDGDGNLVLAIAADTKPIFDFVSGMPGVRIRLGFAGDQMHSKITGVTQGGSIQPQATYNPYVPSKGCTITLRK
jgi:prophage tail gpP-like protein